MKLSRRDLQVFQLSRPALSSQFCARYPPSTLAPSGPQEGVCNYPAVICNCFAYLAQLYHPFSVLRILGLCRLGFSPNHGRPCCGTSAIHESRVRRRGQNMYQLVGNPHLEYQDA